MCGITGFTIRSGTTSEERVHGYGDRLRRMTASLLHRGPDSQTAVLMNGVGLGHTRLAIVDLSSGHQPMTDQETGLTVVFNGEIFNHVELRQQLSAQYQFRTKSDTEVILAAFRQQGIACVQSFVGQFAFALWDPRDQSLWLGRDRVGICPLHYHLSPQGLAFASEAKAIFAGDWLNPELDKLALMETLRFWAPVLPRSAFAGIQALPPGTTACYRSGSLEIRRYWDLYLGPEAVDSSLTEARALEQLEEVLTEAIRLQLRADVPVAAYLSGGLDSSLICALAQSMLGGTLQTFSMQFEQARYDERRFQSEVTAALHTDHRAVAVNGRDIGELLPATVRHAEQVLLRSAPAPFLRLSGMVRSAGTKVVLTGEGADELFWGYDLFREAAVRQFWARQPQSISRPRLLTRLYPYLNLSGQSPAMLRQFYGMGLEQHAAPDFSHQLRASSSGRIARFFSAGFAKSVEVHDPATALLNALPSDTRSWKLLARAQYLEMQTLLSGYLLSAQGDRMLMAHSVEGRFPFLDHRIIEFAARLPPRLKLRGLKEKYLLKRFARRWLPESIAQRQKYPYRAPVTEALAGPAAPQWSKTLLGREAIASIGIFDAAKVDRLRGKLSRPGAVPSEADDMALVAIATTQLLCHQIGLGAAVPHSSVDRVHLVTPPTAVAA